MSDLDTTTYPHLMAILSIKGLPLKPMYTNRDVAQIFDVVPKTIQNWAARGTLTPRDLPGRWRYFPQDLEELLAASSQEERKPASIGGSLRKAA